MHELGPEPPERPSRLIQPEHSAEARWLLTDAIFQELARAGVLTDEMCERVARRFEAEAREQADPGRREMHTTIAMSARAIPIRASAPSGSDVRADYRRRQIVERTERLAAKAARRDGGKEQP